MRNSAPSSYTPPPFFEQLGLIRGDRMATVLFNHDLTVLTYFAAWISGIAVVPINTEETPKKKRYILEHSEAAAVSAGGTISTNS